MRTLMVCLLLTLSILPARAQQSTLQALPILVRQRGHGINLRVTVVNTGQASIHYPYEIHLLVRGYEQEPFRLLKVWHEHNAPSGQKIARDYLPVGDLDPALAHGAYQLQAEVWINGQVVSSNNRIEHDSTPP